MTGSEGEGAIAFICAMPMEIRPLVKRLKLKQAEIRGVEIKRGQVGRREVVAIVTGMGTKLARAGIESLLGAVRVGEVVVVGITGALDGDAKIGSMVFPEVVVDSATGREYRPARRGPGPWKGRMWTGDELTTDPAAIADLRARGVVALDMETAALADVCESHGIPWSVFRAFSDRATDGALNEDVFSLTNQDGTPNAKAVAIYLARNPMEIPKLAKLARGAKLAADQAASAAIGAFSVSL